VVPLEGCDSTETRALSMAPRVVFVSAADGRACARPELSPVACEGERKGAKAWEGEEKVESDPLAPTYRETDERRIIPRDVVVVGAGAAGSAAAKCLRAAGYGRFASRVD